MGGLCDRTLLSGSSPHCRLSDGKRQHHITACRSWKKSTKIRATKMKHFDPKDNTSWFLPLFFNYYFDQQSWKKHNIFNARKCVSILRKRKLFCHLKQHFFYPVALSFLSQSWHNVLLTMIICALTSFFLLLRSVLLFWLHYSVKKSLNHVGTTTISKIRTKLLQPLEITWTYQSNDL